jgi:two-component system OmpR family response regulator
MRLLLVEDDACSKSGCGSNWNGRFRRGCGYRWRRCRIHGRVRALRCIVVLDLGLPGRPGLEVLRHWRAADNPVPVLILTARDAWHEKVDGFKAGADDYLEQTVPYRRTDRPTARAAAAQ